MRLRLYRSASRRRFAGRFHLNATVLLRGFASYCADIQAYFLDYEFASSVVYIGCPLPHIGHIGTLGPSLTFALFIVLKLRCLPSKENTIHFYYIINR
jgi:hypothetical protein